ncbi:MAG: glycosyltransferase family 9 protein [Acidobacteria bacterium]|nr:glycosyltransferase family 9 protein [Acidobacteriota bacterium]
MLTSTSTALAFDCRHFLGDRPCIWHKRENLTCRCTRYEPVGMRILIVKLDAMGDVLRTTALLPLIAEAFPGASVAWITRAESVPLLQQNPYLTEVIPYGPDCTVHLLSRQFDLGINMDAGKISAGLLALARADRKMGYVLDPKGYVTPTNAAAAAWLEMGTNDQLKRSGTRPYQAWMKDILGLGDRPGDRYSLVLGVDEREAGRRHLAQLGVDATKPLVGLNTGAGGRWQLKQWREDGYAALIRRLSRELGVQFVLLGGPSEEARNARLLSAAEGCAVFDPGCHNPVRHFAALVSGCDVIVTGDTLAMHIALALEVRTVVVFGPTSAPEIELYGLGEKVLPDMPCLGCYKNTCDFVPNCMDLISVDMVAEAVRRQLDGAGRSV